MRRRPHENPTDRAKQDSESDGHEHSPSTRRRTDWTSVSGRSPGSRILVADPLPGPASAGPSGVRSATIRPQLRGQPRLWRRARMTSFRRTAFPFHLSTRGTEDALTSARSATGGKRGGRAVVEGLSVRASAGSPRRSRRTRLAGLLARSRAVRNPPVQVVGRGRERLAGFGGVAALRPAPTRRVGQHQIEPRVPPAPTRSCA